MNCNLRTAPRRQWQGCPCTQPSQPAMPTFPQGEMSSLAMAYIKDQVWSEPYARKEGLENGTIFPDLNLPFYGNRYRCPADMSRRER